MSPADDSCPAGFSARSDFTTTRWSLVRVSSESPSEQSREALAKLCQIYWFPIYTYIRKRQQNREEAYDLTQEFFTRLLEKDGLSSADPERGRFRSFLLGAVKNFLANEWDYKNRQKRGGGCQTISLDSESAESRYSREPAHDGSPDKLFERSWAMTLLESVLSQLRQEYAGQQKEGTFEKLKGYLIGEHPGLTYHEVGQELNMSEAAVKVAVYRMRQRYEALIYEEIAHTVTSPDDVQDEIHRLLRAISC